MLAAYTAVQATTVEHGTFDARTREAIAHAASAADRCDYCQAAHTSAARRAGLSLDQIIAACVGDPVEPKLDGLLAVARQAVTGVDSTGSGSAASMLMYVLTDAVTDPERNRRGIAKVDMSAGHSGGGQPRDGPRCGEMT